VTLGFGVRRHGRAGLSVVAARAATSDVRTRLVDVSNDGNVVRPDCVVRIASSPRDLVASLADCSRHVE